MSELRHRGFSARRVVLVVAALLSTGAVVLALQVLLGDDAVASSGVEITSGPSGTQASSDATFTFSSSDGAVSFECSFDGGAYEPCSSPKDYSAWPTVPTLTKVVEYLNQKITVTTK
jgi:hypothetical protein